MAIWGAVNTIPIDLGDIAEQSVPSNYRILTGSYEAEAKLTLPTAGDVVAKGSRKKVRKYKITE